MAKEGAKVDLWSGYRRVKTGECSDMGDSFLLLRGSGFETSNVSFCVAFGGRGAQQVNEEVLS
jgi:hypothetical protein